MPARHCSGLAEELAQANPAGHAAQLRAPAAAEKNPGSQAWQALTLVAE